MTSSHTQRWFSRSKIKIGFSVRLLAVLISFYIQIVTPTRRNRQSTIQKRAQTNGRPVLARVSDYLFFSFPCAIELCGRIGYYVKVFAVICRP